MVIELVEMSNLYTTELQFNNLKIVSDQEVASMPLTFVFSSH